MKKIQKKSFIGAILGTVLEFYDVTLYGFLAAVLAPLFFPTANATLSIIISFGAFAAGFIMRPFGGLVFGYLGDRFGRRQSLMLAVIFVSVPTLILGILPSYAHWGIASPAILIVCRLCQGLCMGGEYSGAAVFISEHTDPRKRGFAGSMLCAAAFAGAVAGSILGALCTLPMMPSWAWRLPFLLGGALGLLSFFYRKELLETQEFENLKNNHQVQNFPLKLILTNYKKSFFCTFIMGSSVQVPFYIVTLYISLIMTQELGYSPSFGIFLNSSIMILWMIFQPLVGYVADRFDRFRIMELSLYGLLLTAYPAFYLIEQYPSLTTYAIAQGVISVAGVWYMGVSPSLMPQLFPAQARVSGMAVSFSLSQAIFSGTTPLIVTAWVAYSGNVKAPALYMILTSLASLGALKVARLIVLEGSEDNLSNESKP